MIVCDFIKTKLPLRMERREQPSDLQRKFISNIIFLADYINGITHSNNPLCNERIIGGKVNNLLRSMLKFEDNQNCIVPDYTLRELAIIKCRPQNEEETKRAELGIANEVIFYMWVKKRLVELGQT